MDAIVLVGGQGLRLRPLTAHRHKSLVPVLNRPAIDHLFGWLERSGFTRVVLALGQANEDLAAAYPAGRFGSMELLPIFERERLESGGAIRNAVQSLDIQERFTVINGDVFVDFDFQKALSAHSERGARLTMALKEMPDPWSFGVAALDGAGVITGFVEKPPPGTEPSRLVNAGVWIFERDLVEEIPPGAVRVEETLFPSLVARRQLVLGHELEGTWADIGTAARYLALSNELLGDGCAIADGAAIDPGATIRGTAVGPGSQVGADAAIENSILWENVSVESGAIIANSILADGVSVGAGAQLNGVAAGKGARFAAGVTPPTGAVLEPGQLYDGNR